MSKRLVQGAGAILFVGVVSAVLMVLRVQISSIPFIVSVEQLPPHPDVVMILGGGIEDAYTPSDALADRLLVGERVARRLGAPILLTGDGGRFRSAEIPVMTQWMLDRGVSPDRLVIDDEGFRTYESCRRAKEVYHLTQIVVITQRFHLARAVYLCRAFGMEVYGVPANVRPYKNDALFLVRDVLASVKAWLDVHVLHPAPPV